MALYRDGPALFEHNARKAETAATVAEFARSPQAKGRVERAARTFQDRLVTALRLADASTIDQANAVLQDCRPRYNPRLAVQPEHPEPAYRLAAPDLCQPEVLCFKDTRKVGRDNTVKYQWRELQLIPDEDAPAHPLNPKAQGMAANDRLALGAWRLADPPGPEW